MPPIDLEPMLERIRGAIARERSVVGRLRALPTGTRALIAVALSVLPLAFFFAHRIPPDRTATLEASALFGTMLVAAAVVSLWPLQRDESRFGSMAVVVAGFLLPFAMAPLGPGGGAGPIGEFGCFLAGTAVGCGLIVALRWLDRTAHRSATHRLAAIAVAGVATNFALHFACRYTGALHRMVGHATIGLELLVLGTLVTWLERAIEARLRR
jgi:hypothetical protein